MREPLVPPFVRQEGFGTLGSDFAEPKLPEPVPFDPATPGAWISLVLGVALLVSPLLWAWLRFRRRRHRRVAAAELESLEREWRAAGHEDALRSAHLERLPIIVKVCALGSFGRARVGPLSGPAWVEFLNHTSPRSPFSGSLGETLVLLCTRGAGAVPSDQVPPLFAAARTWIVDHRGERARA